MTCGFCALEFQTPAGRALCDGCPVSGGCRGVRCPRCGYDMPEEPPLLVRLGSLARRWMRTGAAPAPMLAVVGLERLAVSQRAEVERLDTADLGAARKLVALGVVPGARLEVEKRHPSIVVRLGATRLAIDASLATAVQVRVRG